jgi:hypothetical protein
MAIGIGLLLPVDAWANPVVVDGVSFLSFWIVLFWAFVLEAGLVALLLALRGASVLRVFGGFFAGTLAVGYAPFCCRCNTRLPRQFNGSKARLMERTGRFRS